MLYPNLTKIFSCQNKVALNALNFWRLELDPILSPFDSNCEVIVPLTEVLELLIYLANKIYEIGVCSFVSGQ